MSDRRKDAAAAVLLSIPGSIKSVGSLLWVTSSPVCGTQRPRDPTPKPRLPNWRGSHPVLLAPCSRPVRCMVSPLWGTQRLVTLGQPNALHPGAAPFFPRNTRAVRSRGPPTGRRRLVLCHEISMAPGRGPEALDPGVALPRTRKKDVQSGSCPPIPGRPCPTPIGVKWGSWTPRDRRWRRLACARLELRGRPCLPGIRKGEKALLPL